MENTTRRSMLQLAGWLSVSLATPEWELLAAALRQGPADSAGGSLRLQPQEMADLEAMTSLIIPTDTTPGAREAGVAQFIDRALGSILSGAAAEFRVGLAEFQRGVLARYPGSTSFASLSSSQQTEWLHSIEHSPFFALVRELTVLGMFSNPSYGGNRGGVGWQLLGFKDEHVFTPPFGHYDRDYPGFQIPGRGES